MEWIYSTLKTLWGSRSRLVVFAILLGALSTAEAQYAIKSGVYNRISLRVPDPNPNGIPPLGTSTVVPNGPPTTLPQFAGFAESSSATGVIPGTLTVTYPSSVYTNGGVTSGLLLTRSSLGTGFASGIPRYSLGDVIVPPSAITNVAGEIRTVDAASFWRANPLAPGEVVINPSGTSPTDYRDGVLITSATLAAGILPDYYYSPHAKTVFASAPGTVSLTWVSNLPDPTTRQYIFYKETFTVSVAARMAVRNIYWTERGYNGPQIAIPSGQISRVNPVFNNYFPETVASEVIIAGDSTRSTSTSQQSVALQEQSQVIRTLWYEKFNGVGRLHAYNITGRVLVEYLGAERSDGTFEFLGVDVVNVERSLPSVVQNVELGNEIRPYDGTQTDARTSLQALPVSAGGESDQTPFYGSAARPDGSLAYYAERTNDIPERVSFYWLEPQPIGGGASLSSTAANTLINWPKYLNQYTLSWPGDITRYAHYTVGPGGSSVASGTGLQFPGGNLPQVVFQDSSEGDLTQDTLTQRLLVNFNGETDQLNRSLLKFMGTNGAIWYVPMMAQSMGRTDYVEGDGTPAVTGTVYVGERLEPPSPDYSTAAFIAEGNCYSPSAYINPFTSGVPAAELGAVIPVNALPAGQTSLTVWWFKKIAAKSVEFNDFYVPAKIGRYTVSYRENISTVETFEQGPASEWTNNRTFPMTAPVSAGLTASNVFGPFSAYSVGGTSNTTRSGPVTFKTYSPGVQAADGVTISFQLYRVDQWLDHSFRVYVQPTGAALPIEVLSQSFSSATPLTTLRTGSLSTAGVNYSWSIAPVANSYADFVRLPSSTSSVNDQVLSVTVTALPLTRDGADSLAAYQLGFGSNLDSSAGAFAIDNLTVSMAIPKIVLASNRGSGSLPANADKGVVYNQPNPNAVGYNPNEEHALILDGVAYALRDDLNVVTGNDTTSEPRYTSQRRVLIQYTNPEDNRPAMAVYAVERENALYNFDYDVTAGTILNGLSPMPLPLLPLALSASGDSMNTEVNLGAAYAEPGPATGAPSGYASFTYKDRKGYDWVYRGPHRADGNPGLGMRFYYPMRPEFVFPGLTTQPATGTALPYLRPLNAAGTFIGDPVTGTPLSVVYRPKWPDTPPTMSVGETLTLQKTGLPAVRGQTSAQVLYQQSVALGGTGSPSVTLADPTRAKTVLINTSAVGLTALPASIKTTMDSGKTYFQLAQPHLQKRFYFSPLLGSKGGLVLEGAFHDVAAGEDYLDLNTLSPADVAALKGLVASTDVDSEKWGKAIDALSTKVQIFVKNQAKPGTFIADPDRDVIVNGVTLPEVLDSNTAVDSYALTALGKGSGYVTLVFGDGAAFTPTGEPVSMQIIKVANTLYKGDLKAIFAANPLDEQTTLRHSGDFGAHPEYYDFQWRYFTGSVAPSVYSYGVQCVLGAAESKQWSILPQPQATPAVGASLVYPDATTPTPFSLSINSGSYSSAAGLPGKMLLAADSLNFAAGLPSQVFFSTTLSDTDGFVVYVNNVPALAYNLPVGIEPPGGLNLVTARVGLVASNDGLPRQFEIDPKFFRAGSNRLEVALYSPSPAPSAPSSLDFKVHVPAKTDLVQAVGSEWMAPTGTLSNSVVLGGAASSPIGNPLLVFSDSFFTVRYKPRAGLGLVVGSGETDWSEWTEPVFVASWVKRVLDGINPFNQRQTDFRNNAISTDVSLLTQAGKRWEGDVALTLSNINDFGLIEIYETVLNRVKAQSIDAGVTTQAVNNTLLLAAGYLSDLYMIGGDEAADDALNPTLQIGGNDGSVSVSSSRFSFEGQVASLMDETLALWRGRDDFATRTSAAPVYNRLYWNYVNGINSGEPIYAENYNIKEKTGPAADGVIDASDAMKMYPQGHGDAYGHYLTALKVYYKLFTNDTFTWVPSSETVSIVGQTVAVDYKDERKFAKAAASLANAGYMTLNLTARQSFKDSEEEGWSSFTEQKLNSSTGVVRGWGSDEWASRAYQGAYFNWINGNAMLPVEDTLNEGISKIDRSTVPELGELVTTARKIFTLSSELQAFINPLGLGADTMAFDINSTELAGGKTHFEQIYDRAVRAGVNASQSFAEAGKMSALLRQQANTVDDYNDAIEQQESNYEYQLINLFGTPYAGDMGPGALYAQNYTGPDFYHAQFIDNPSPLVDTANVVNVVFREPVNLGPFSTWDLDSVYNRVSAPGQYAEKTLSVDRFSIAQFATPAMGRRQQVGKIQSAMLDCYQAQVNLRESINTFNELRKRFDRDYQLFSEMIAGTTAAQKQNSEAQKKVFDIANARLAVKLAKSTYGITKDYVKEMGDALSEIPPRTNGFSNDVTSLVRYLSKYGGLTIAFAQDLKGIYEEAKEALMATKSDEIEQTAEELLNAFNQEMANKQHVAEFQNLYSKLLSTAFDLNRRTAELQQATERVSQIYGEANRIISQRQSARIRAAAVVQGYRTRDVVYRSLRNEKLAAFSALFDLAQTYTYCAVKAYDYETGLLGSPSGKSFVSSIVGTCSIGDFSNDNPVRAKLGDPGLAGILGAVRDDWTVARRRLGFNNPDRNGTMFSMRQELFRVRADQPTADDNLLWKQVLQQRVMTNLLDDPDVVKSCSNLPNANGGPVPGIVIPFSTVIQRGLNFFGWPLAGGDHAFSQSVFATKILSAGVMFEGYVGMDPVGEGAPASTSPNAMSATPDVYLIPVGLDFMRAPALGDQPGVRSWLVKDQALPLPVNIGNVQYSSLQPFTPQGTLNEQLWIPRKHQAFRPVDSASYFYGSMPAEYTNSRLVGRSVWNSRWKLVIPAGSLHSDEQTGINNFINAVSDVKLFLRTYSNSGN